MTRFARFRRVAGATFICAGIVAVGFGLGLVGVALGQVLP